MHYFHYKTSEKSQTSDINKPFYIRMFFCSFFVLQTVLSGDINVFVLCFEVTLSSVGSVVLLMVSLRSQVFSSVVSVDWLTAGCLSQSFISQHSAHREHVNFAAVLISLWFWLSALLRLNPVLNCMLWIRWCVSHVKGCSLVHRLC